MNLDRSAWFQILNRCWRPLQQWGFAVVSVGYASRPLFDLSFHVETFAALAAASGVGFIGRGLEKFANTRTVAKHAPHHLKDSS